MRSGLESVLTAEGLLGSVGVTVPGLVYPGLVIVVKKLSVSRSKINVSFKLMLGSCGGCGSAKTTIF